MSQISGYGPADHQRVNDAIAAAESQTGAEIIPVIAGSSGRYDRPEDIVGLWCAMLALVAGWALYPLPEVDSGHWGGPGAVWQIVTLLAAAVGGFVVGAIVASRVDWLRRLFTPAAQMEAEVDRRAREVFFDRRVHHTAHSSGLLLYVSLFEHRAAVIADQRVLDALGQSKLDAVCREFTDRLHKSGPIDAICETAAALATQLSSGIPRTPDDTNEHADALVVIE
jgi:putative membrane protein